MVNSSSLFAFTASMSKLARFFGDGRRTIASLINGASPYASSPSTKETSSKDIANFSANVFGDDPNLDDADEAFLLGGLELMSCGFEGKASLLVLLFEDEAPLDILLSMFLIILLRL